MNDEQIGGRLLRGRAPAKAPGSERQRDEGAPEAEAPWSNQSAASAVPAEMGDDLPTPFLDAASRELYGGPLCAAPVPVDPAWVCEEDGPAEGLEASGPTENSATPYEPSGEPWFPGEEVDFFEFVRGLLADGCWDGPAPPRSEPVEALVRGPLGPLTIGPAGELLVAEGGAAGAGATSGTATSAGAGAAGGFGVPWWLGPAAAVVVGLVLPANSQEPWMDEANEITGLPYRSQAERHFVEGLTEEEKTSLKEAWSVEIASAPSPGVSTRDDLKDDETQDDAEDECAPEPLSHHRGGDAIHDACADAVEGNQYPGRDVQIGSKAFDALDGSGVAWEVKTERYSDYSEFLKDRHLHRVLEELEHELQVAEACGMPLGIRIADPELYEEVRKWVETKVDENPGLLGMLLVELTPECLDSP